MYIYEYRKKHLLYSLQTKTVNRTKKSSHWNTKSQKQTGTHIQWAKVTQSIPWTYENLGKKRIIDERKTTKIVSL